MLWTPGQRSGGWHASTDMAPGLPAMTMKLSSSDPSLAYQRHISVTVQVEQGGGGLNMA